MKRATTIDEMAEKLSRLRTPESLERALAFSLRDDDVLISPFAKCGTTWMQQIVHSLRSRGDLDFEEISAAVPWLELAYDLGIDLEADQGASPRAFKSHLSADDAPEGGRAIIVFRDPIDAMTSMYRFFEGWFFEPGAITYRDFACDYFIDREGGKNYWTHTVSWARRRYDPAVLALAYDDMKARLPDVVERVAAFIGVALDDELRAITLDQASHASMKRRADQFDERLTRRARDAACGLPQGGAVSKVGVGDRTPLIVTDEIRSRYDAQWRRVLGAAGFETYEDLARAVAL